MTAPKDDDKDREDPTGTEDDPGTGDDDDPNDEDEGKYEPPSQEEWERMQRTLVARKREVTRLRKAASAVKNGNGGTDADKKDEPAVPSSDARVVRLAAQTALAGEGMTREQARLAAGLLKLQDIELDDDEDPDDLDFTDAIADLKRVFPQLFTPTPDDTDGGKRQRRRPNGRPRGDATSKGDGVMDDMSRKLLESAGYR